MELLDLELKRLSREPAECTLSLLLLDVDHFKRINDRHGHPAGDEVLRLLAGRLVGAVRATDLVARYGGEEFTILLPATDLEGAALAARKVQATISGTAFDLGTHSIPVSVSIGVAGARWRGGSFEDATSGLIQRADAALYTAKRRGRDRVVVEKAGRFEESVLGREAPGRPPRLVRAAS